MPIIKRRDLFNKKAVNVNNAFLWLGVRLEQELEDDVGGGFDEFGHGFGKNSLEMSLGLILMSLMSLGVRVLCVCCIWRCV